MIVSKLDVNIGIDFGTSYTKVCVRGDDTEKSEVVTFSGSNLDQALLVTKVGILSDNSLIAGLTEPEWEKLSPGAKVVIDFIKMRLANFDLQHEGRWFEFAKVSSFGEEDIENLCTYYLATVITRTKQWFIENFPDRTKNVEIAWTINVGVPVRYCNSKALNRFEKVLKLGWYLSESSNLKNLNLQELDNILKSHIKKLDEVENCFVVPEVAAGTYAFTASRSATPGEYTFIDIGSGTVESVAFSFTRDKKAILGFIAAYVYPTGVDTLIEGVAKASACSVSQIKEMLLRNDYSIIDEIYALIEKFASQLSKGEYIATIAMWNRDSQKRNFDENTFITQQRIETLLESSSLKPRDRLILEIILWQMIIHLQTAKVVNVEKAKNEIFLGGGGASILFYQYTIRSTYRAFKQYRTHAEPYIIKEIPTPSNQDFSMSGVNPKYFNRFAIAYGLSIPIYEMPTFSLPQSSQSAQIDTLIDRVSISLATMIRKEAKPSKEDLPKYDDFREYSNRSLGGRVQD